MYNFLRTKGFEVEDIVEIMQGPNKIHAIGELALHPDNVNSNVTFHHQWYVNPWDRLPRLAGGTVHNYNIFADGTDVLEARRLRDSIAASMSPADQNTLNNTYNFKPPINGSISVENGAMLTENSVYIDINWPLRNNQTDPSNPVYTGKIKAEDTIYMYHEQNGEVTYVRGDSTDLGNPLGPFQAPVIPFSWNTPDGQRPYAAPPMHDPSMVQAIVTSSTAGAGSRILQWDKINWLKTSYEPIVTGIPGDFDGDNDVDGRDFLMWQRNPSIDDLSNWQQNFGSGSLGVSVSVPEPTNAVLAALCLLAYPLKRSRF
jgi:hypothetical protein